MDIILVTGASGQLGTVVVKTLANAGFKVIAVAGKHTGSLKHEHVEWFSADLTSEHAVAELTSSIFEKYPEIDAGVFLAGGYRYGAVSVTGGDEMQFMFDLNFFTAYHISRKVFLNMQQQGRGGRLVFIGSLAGQEPANAVGSIGYALSKSLLFRYSEALNREGVTSGIISAVVVPATIDTEENRKAMPLDDRSYWVSPEEVSDIILEAIRSSHPKMVINVSAGD